jgi:excinuclease ABC subunit B
MNTVITERPTLPTPDGSIPFQIVSNFTPAGDQPQAIAELLKGLRADEKDQVLLGVTGSGKTFTMAHVIQEMNRPALVLAPGRPAIRRNEIVLPA